MALRITKVAPKLPEPWRPEIAELPQRTEDYPADRPLDWDEVKSALWHGQGNIQRASALLRTPPARLGALLRKAPELEAIRREAAELILDKAEHVILEGLEDADPLRQDGTARFVLEKAGRGRGWTKDGQTGLNMSFDTGSGAKSGAIAVRWMVDE